MLFSEINKQDTHPAVPHRNDCNRRFYNARWRCTVCGWETEKEMDELPDDFECPVCGAGKEDFEVIE